MSKTLFLEDVFGENWQSEVREDARIEVREPLVRGLGRERYKQLWQLFQREDHVDVLYHLARGSSLQEAAEKSGLSQRQVINTVAEFLRMARYAFEQPELLPPISFDEAYTPSRRVKSNRGRPPKRLAPPTPNVVDLFTRTRTQMEDDGQEAGEDKDQSVSLEEHARWCKENGY